MKEEYILLVCVPTWGHFPETYHAVRCDTRGWEDPVEDTLIFETIEEAEEYIKTEIPEGSKVEIYTRIKSVER